MERRLAAILAADVVGYTRLMGADEAGTLRRFTELRQQDLEPLIAEHHGRVFKLIGDGLLVEFASLVDALVCAEAWQKVVAAREEAVSEDKRLKFRIGVNLGDVIVEGDDIHGDGVNIAARIESLAEPGGICLSYDAYRHAKGKLEMAFDDLGEQVLKNVAEPVRVYRVSGERPFAAQSTPEPATLLLPDKPSIAVLPFTNMSGDPEQEHFSDGITEDIITVLSQVSDLLVIARNSTFSYKDKVTDVKQIGRDLGARYVLGGSVRRASNRLRVTSQLIDASDGHHLWAERYDRRVHDLFDVQDDITRNVATALLVTLDWGGTSRHWLKDTQNFEAWQLGARATKHLYKFNPLDNAEARRLSEQALDIVPDMAAAKAMLAWTYWLEARYFHPPNPDEIMQQVDRLAEEVMTSRKAPVQAYHLKGALHMVRGESELAVAALSRAIDLAPSNAEVHGFLAIVLVYAGRATDAVASAKMAMRLSPRCPEFVLWALTEAYRWTGALDRALASAKRCAEESPESLHAYIKLASIYTELDQDEMARKAAERVLALDPKFSATEYGRTQNYTDPTRTNHVIETLRQAGLPN